MKRWYLVGGMRRNIAGINSQELHDADARMNFTMPGRIFKFGCPVQDQDKREYCFVPAGISNSQFAWTDFEF